MNNESQLEELLLLWEQARRESKVLTAAELCRDCPELCSDVEQRIQALEAMDPAIELPQSREFSGAGTERNTGVESPPGYELEKCLGGGGFGQVWKALGPGGFPVALKFVPLGQRRGDVELRSLELFKNIRHPHLLALFGAWQFNGYLVIAMELADRTDGPVSRGGATRGSRDPPS